MKMRHATPSWWTLLSGTLLAALTMGISSVSAQISVSMEPVKKMYVVHEPTTVKVSIVNRAGRDLVLAGRGNSSWLTFDVTDSKGRLASSVRGTGIEPVLIPAGQQLTRTIAVNEYYSMGQLGLYRIRASAYFSQLDQYFSSTTETVQISEGREMWSQVVGVPEGQEGAGEFRRYSLLSFNNGSSRHLYVRVQREPSGGTLTTYSLGKLIVVRDPEWTVDSSNRLHVLHQGAPKTYAHTVVGANGEVLSREIYREQVGNRPRLSPDGVGDITVVGGVSDREARENPMGGLSVKKLSDRPPGLPRP